MADLSMKGLDEGLMRGLKVEAARLGKTLREHVIEILTGEDGNGFREASGIERKAGVQGVRGGVRGGRKGKRVSQVLRPSDDAPADSSTVVRGEQTDRGGEGPAKVVWGGPAHSKTCGCGSCLAKRAMSPREGK